MKTRILASIITGILATSAAQADSAFSTNDLDVIYTGLNPSFTRDVDVSGYYTTPPQLQDVSGYYTMPQQLQQTAAQADSPSPIDVIYSGLNPSFTRNLDVTGYYTAPAQLQQAAHKSACNWSVAKNDLNLLKAAYTVSGNTEYFAPANLQLVC